ncbi:TetR/AcrR family transcriptional regulator [Actinoplanes sp. TBRC 11911]|uniref:TetR family transcriptional regulator n=1 Tax=Actinoplanes sp. TBRC 11911 TaxID=2729386 RepID=UPI00145D7908|nr:TetR family transcriptional regulator [Actinoplanes sp. TBRC 11911]NMO55338.1 TetR/AcrR family transcriptional regulator [Actinoplanes sp. TBRC 11911]
MSYDSAATRTRLLDAAYEEFSLRGLAGARVDRIATAAKANKQAIYAYFGSKEELFDAVLAARLTVLADTVPFTADDLPRYIGTLFDALVAAPDLMRLTRWRRLERGNAVPGEVESHAAKARDLRTAMDLPDDRTAIDILAIVVAMASAWLDMPVGLRASGPSSSKRLRAHREVLVMAVQAICNAVAEPR